MALDDISDEEIIAGSVTPEQKITLETKLLIAYFSLAKERGIKIELINDKNVYEKLRQERKLFDGEKFYLLVNDDGFILDYSPPVYHLIDTPDGLTYGKIMQL